MVSGRLERRSSLGFAGALKETEKLGIPVVKSVCVCFLSGGTKIPNWASRCLGFELSRVCNVYVWRGCVSVAGFDV